MCRFSLWKPNIWRGSVSFSAGAEVPLPPAAAADPMSESGEATSHNKIRSDFQWWHQFGDIRMRPGNCGTDCIQYTISSWIHWEFLGGKVCENWVQRKVRSRFYLCQLSCLDARWEFAASFFVLAAQSVECNECTVYRTTDYMNRWKKSSLFLKMFMHRLSQLLQYLG